MKKLLLLILCLGVAWSITCPKTKLLQPSVAKPTLQIANSNKDQPKKDQQVAKPEHKSIITAFAKQGIRISTQEAQKITESVRDALQEAYQHGIGNSKVDFISIEIAQKLGLDTGIGSRTVQNVSSAIKYLLTQVSFEAPKNLAWESYYNKTLSLNSDQNFLSLVRKEKFSPVKISWEDIGRHQGSSWGDRISDVGIWVRQNEADSQSAQLALSVRRDQNFRDKVLVVPSDRIKIHRQSNGKTQELTLSQRLKELKLFSKKRDRNVIVSNQFAVLPVPAHDMTGAWKKGVPPRAAFNFSIFPYGSTNYVITDVIEGSSEAIVGPGNHQYLYYNVNGKKAPFTASRAEDRPDLLELEAQLKAQGMDVDVQRYYLIQIPLKKGKNIQLSNMGTPPLSRGYGVGSGGIALLSDEVEYEMPSPPTKLYKKGKSLKKSPKKSPSKSKKKYKKPNKPKVISETAPPPSTAVVKASSSESLMFGEVEADEVSQKDADQEAKESKDPTEGLTKVAIGHGETEGSYFGGKGYEGTRDDAPIRVTVVYFVTPVGEVTSKDMETFTAAFKKWDSQAIWGGSFVTKESW